MSNKTKITAKFLRAAGHREMVDAIEAEDQEAIEAAYSVVVRESAALETMDSTLSDGIAGLVDEKLQKAHLTPRDGTLYLLAFRAASLVAIRAAEAVMDAVGPEDEEEFAELADAALGAAEAALNKAK